MLGKTAIGACLVWWCSGALGAEVYRCAESNAFVASLALCPGGKGSRIGGTATGDKPAALQAPPARLGSQDMSARRSPDLAPPRQPDTMTPPAGPHPFAHCQALPEGEPRAQCQRAAIAAPRNQEAQRRFHALSRAFGEQLAALRSQGGTAGLNRGGKGGPWCESFLGDFLAGRNFEPVSDPSLPTPKWRTAPDAETHPVMDPNYADWRYAGRVYPSGYVTTRWQSRTYTVFFRATCFADSGAPRCAPQPYTGIEVYDGETPQACSVFFVDAAYWGNFKDTAVPLNLAGPAGSKIGLR